MPKLAICIASYNSAKFLPELFESLKVQTFKDFKIYIVYDGSTDNTLKVVKKYQKELPIVVVDYKPVARVGLNKNRVVSIALKDKPDYIQMIDADDKVLPRFLEAGIERLHKGDVDWAIVWGRLFGGREGYIHSQIPTLNDLTRNNNLLHSWGMFKREVLEKHNFAKELTSGADWQLWIDLTKDGYKGSIVEEELYLKRWHEGSISSTDKMSHEELREKVLSLTGFKDKSKKYTFHYISMPHLPVTKGYCACAFTNKIHKLSRMMANSGHQVHLYGVGYTDIKHPNIHFHPVVSMDDVIKEWGEGDNRFELNYDWHTKGFKHDLNQPPTPTTLKFRTKTIELINKIKKPDDFLLLSQGYYHKPIADAVRLYLTCEPGIGYRGSYAKFRAFESSYIMYFTYGSEHPRQSINGSYYDRVIPNYFDLDDFEFNDKPKDYLFFIGRLIPRKGVRTAILTAQELGMKIKLAGQGKLKDIGINYKGIEYVGVVGIEERKKLYANALVSFTPTIYLEPFGGVAVESMLSGTPVVSTNFGSFTDINLDGVSGYRCDTLQDFVDNTRKAMKLDRKKVREYAERFSMENVNKLFEKWWSDLYQVYLSTDGKTKGWYNINDIQKEM